MNILIRVLIFKADSFRASSSAIANHASNQVKHLKEVSLKVEDLIRWMVELLGRNAIVSQIVTSKTENAYLFCRDPKDFKEQLPITAPIVYANAATQISYAKPIVTVTDDVNSF